MDTTKLKSFWEKPEGNTGLIVIGGLVVGASILILKNIDTLIALAQNTLYLGFLLGAIFLIVSLLMNKRFRWLCASMFQSAMRAITSIWIAVDPIGILKNYLEDMKDKMRKIAGYITQLAAQVGKVEHDIANRERVIEECLRTAQAAKRRNEQNILLLQSNMAAREKQYIDRRRMSLKKMKDTLEILKKMEQGLDFLYQDTEHQVSILEAEYQSVKAAYNAMKGAQDLIEGDDAKAIFEQTCQYVADEIGSKLGEMDRFMEKAHGPLTTMDLNNEVFNEKGLELLTSWEKDGIMSYRSGQLDANKPGTKVRIATTTTMPANLSVEEIAEIEAQANASIGNTQNNSFARIFNK